MKRLFVSFIGVVMVAQAAFAFEQTGTKGGAAAATSGQAQAPAGKLLDLQAGGVATKPGAGSGVLIPGLGALGVLPKLDFGLELLYGEGRPASAATRDAEAAPDDDGLRIKGTLKHRF